MKICDYCGRSNENEMLFCAGCGTALAVLREDCTTSASVLAKPPRTLNAKTATIILLAYLAAQLFCGLVMGATSTAIAAAYGIQSVQQIYVISDALEPLSMVFTFVLGGLVIITMSFKLIPKCVKNAGPDGAAWVLGRWRAILVALVIGLIVGLSAQFLIMLVPHASYNGIGPITRIALMPGLPQITVVVVALSLAPIVEEMLFRGVLYGGYRKSFGPVLAAIFTTLFFVALHVPEYAHSRLGIIWVVMEALVALKCRLHWEAIGPAIAVHIGFNSIAVLIVICRASVTH